MSAKQAQYFQRSSYGAMPSQSKDEMESGFHTDYAGEEDLYQNDTRESSGSSARGYGTAVLGVAGLVVFTICAATGYNYVYTGAMTKLLSAGPAVGAPIYKTTSTICDSMKITASNEYGVFSAPYPFVQNGEILLEPYKATTVVVSFSDDTDADSYTYAWTIGEDTFTGSSITTTRTTTGTYDVTIAVTDSDSNSVCSFSQTAYVKYVKRELRSLTEADRDKVLDAAATLWKYNAVDGKALYGDAYVPLQTFVEVHSMASNDIMCDQYHEGTGFLTHHLALGLSFEASVRAVDPSVTIPYWDFTIEGEYVANIDGNPSDMLDMTPFFTEDWFGSVDEDNHVADGRWAHALMPSTSDASLTHNSYGYIRSYWNNNNDPEISRMLFSSCGVEPTHKTIPSCDIHYSVLDAATLGDFQTLSPGDGHGPLHVQTGGVWGGCTDAIADLKEKYSDLFSADVTEDELTAAGIVPDKFFNKWGTSNQRNLMLETAVLGEYFHIYRSFWRSHMCANDTQTGYLVCPESCDADTPFEECSCQVDALVNGETTTDNLLGCVLNDDNQVFFKAAFPQEFLDDLVTVTATASVIEGEMVESASTADPLFWFIHPVIERLLQAKRLPDVLNMGSKTFSKWDVVDGSAETFKEYSYYSFDAGDKSFYPEAYTCTGHASADAALPSGLVMTPIMYTNGADTDGDGVISNMEFFLALDPNDPDKNDYVYDNFNWDHCS
jgi:hypothetical protein